MRRLVGPALCSLYALAPHPPGDLTRSHGPANRAEQSACACSACISQVQLQQIMLCLHRMLSHTVWMHQLLRRAQHNAGIMAVTVCIDAHLYRSWYRRVAKACSRGWGRDRQALARPSRGAKSWHPGTAPKGNSSRGLPEQALRVSDTTAAAGTAGNCAHAVQPWHSLPVDMLLLSGATAICRHQLTLCSSGDAHHAT